MEEQTFKGPLDVQLRAAFNYISGAVLKEKIFKHDDRAEADRIWNYPYAAVEETLANAVYHRSYVLPIHEAFKAEAEERNSPHPAKTREKSVEKTREKTGEKILRYLAENPAATQNDIVAVIGISVKGVEWNLTTLKENGRLRRVGPDKGGYWEVIGQA